MFYWSTTASLQLQAANYWNFLLYLTTIFCHLSRRQLVNGSLNRHSRLSLTTHSNLRILNRLSVSTTDCLWPLRLRRVTILEERRCHYTVLISRPTFKEVSTDSNNTQYRTFVSFSIPLRLPKCSQSLSALTSAHCGTISLTAILHVSTAQYVAVRTCLRGNFLLESGKHKNISSLQGKTFLS
jgi:hypothetical protein